MVSPTRHIEAMERINTLLNVRERTVKEVQERLARSGFDQEEIEDAVSSALRVGLINEERYTRAYIRGKTHSGWGRLKILQKLRQNGIQEHTIELCSDEFVSPDAELDSALHELSKRVSHSKDPYSSYMRRLVGKGYSFEISSRAVKTFMQGNM